MHAASFAHTTGPIWAVFGVSSLAFFASDLPGLFANLVHDWPLNAKAHLANNDSNGDGR